MLGLLLLLATAGFAAAGDPVTCKGKQYKVDEQERIWEKPGSTWTQIGDRCLNLVCSRRNLFCYGHDNTLWRYNGTPNSWTPANELSAGQQLSAGTVMGEAQNLVSNNGNYFLYMQENGDIGIWAKEPRQVQWSSRTADKANCTLKMQPDGNLVVYDATGQPVWASQMQGATDQRYNDAKYKPVRLLVTDDGRAELISATGFKVWDSKDGRSPLN